MPRRVRRAPTLSLRNAHKKSPTEILSRVTGGSEVVGDVTRGGAAGGSGIVAGGFGDDAGGFGGDVGVVCGDLSGIFGDCVRATAGCPNSSAGFRPSSLPKSWFSLSTTACMDGPLTCGISCVPTAASGASHLVPVAATCMIQTGCGSKRRIYGRKRPN